MAEEPLSPSARLAVIAERQAELRRHQRFYSDLVKKKDQAHQMRKRWAAGVGIGIGAASAGLGFVGAPWVGVVLAASGIGVPLWGERQDAWDKNVVKMATQRLRAIDEEADALEREVTQLRS